MVMLTQYEKTRSKDKIFNPQKSLKTFETFTFLLLTKKFGFKKKFKGKPPINKFEWG